MMIIFASTRIFFTIKSADKIPVLQKASDPGLPSVYFHGNFLKFYQKKKHSLFVKKCPKRSHFWGTLKLIPNLMISRNFGILAKSVRNRHASFTFETENVTRAKAPR